ncbi:MAG: hypothetical protein A4S09_14875 [Proteobacteria bacterium SG_bin7]|nr:MAG: hypothetical protein A4S09_14875 [Proteobacteria bacterium SG_bin7]
MTNESLKNWQILFFSYITSIEESLLHTANSMNEMSVRSCADIYRRGYKARLVESLGDTYSATWWVLGDEDFLKLADEFVESVPSRSFDLSDYGKEFSDFLKDSPVISEIPFLSELAQFEWNFKTLFHTKDIPNVENIFRYVESDPNVKIYLLPSAILWKSDFAIYEIWKRREENVTSLNEIDLGKSESILCFKINGKVNMTSLEESDLRMLQQFETPRSIEDAVASYQSRFGEVTPESIQRIFSRIGALGVLGV